MLGRALWRPLPMAAQLSSGAGPAVATGMAMVCRWSDGIGGSGNAGIHSIRADMPDGMAAACSGIAYDQRL